MTRRERVEAVLSGEIPDCVPFAPNIGQWFGYHKAHDSLPDELSACRDVVDAMIAMDCDIFSRQCGAGMDIVCPDYPIAESPDAGNPDVTHYTQQTPVGGLTCITEFDRLAWTTFARKPWWSNWQEYSIVRHIIEHSQAVFDESKWQESQNRLGSHGIAMVNSAKSPLRYIIQLAGPENGLIWAMTHEREILELCDIYTDLALEGFRQVADCPDVVVAIAMDNLDTAFYPPYIIEKFMRRFFQTAADIMHGAGKYFYIHGCGQTKANLPILAQMKIDGIEGITHPPLGDVEYHQVQRQCWDGFIVHGGMSCIEQEFKQKAQVVDYCRNLFERMRPFKRFVFSSSCQTSPLTPYENLLTFRDCCRQFGRS